MKNYYTETWNEAIHERFVVSGKANAFLSQVFVTMTLGLAITGLTSWFFGQELLKLMDGYASPFAFLFQSPVRYIVMFAPLAFVLALSFGIERMSFTTASVVFGAYALVNGISLSFIFAMFSAASIAKVFFITAGTFGAMAAVGYFTKTDLSKFGSILMMALIGLIIASLVNFFLKSTMFDYIISGVGVLIFCGLTAFDVQNLVQMGAGADMQSDGVRKATVMGALALYLDFVNLFLYLLRFFGSSRD